MLFSFILSSTTFGYISIKSAVTDSEREIRYDLINKPGVSNLLELYSACLDMDIDVAEQHFLNKNYGSLKKELSEVVVEMLRPIQEKYNELANAPDELYKLLERGAKIAEEIAFIQMIKVRNAIGLIRPS